MSLVIATHRECKGKKVRSNRDSSKSRYYIIKKLLKYIERKI